VERNVQDLFYGQHLGMWLKQYFPFCVLRSNRGTASESKGFAVKFH